MAKIPPRPGGLLANARHIWKHEIPIHNKIGIGLGVTGLTLATGNLANNQRKLNLEAKRQTLDVQSLKALKEIHEALITKSNA
jgi:hypothetical protein